MYALLCNYASEKDHCWPSHATLAARLSCSVNSVKKYLGELVTVKLIEIRKEQYRSSVYYMMYPAELRPETAPRASQLTPDCRPSHSDRQSSDFGGQPSNSGYLNTLSKQSQEENPPLPPTDAEAPKAVTDSGTPAAGGVSVSFHDFEKAWELYPKKDAQGFARMAWNKLQRGGLLPPLATILEAISRFAASESWQREQGRFVPQMGNWLRGQRWLDPLSPAEEAEAKERQRQVELRQALQAQEEKEKRLQEQRNAEKARLRPVFDGFAARFAESVNDAMAFGTWLYLHSKGLAPSASDVPHGNALGIVDFMNAFKRQREEAAYRNNLAKSQTNRPDARPGGLMPCGDLLRHSPVFSCFFSGTEGLRLAV